MNSQRLRVGLTGYQLEVARQAVNDLVHLEIRELYWVECFGMGLQSEIVSRLVG